MPEHDPDVVENKQVKAPEKTTTPESAAQDAVIGGKDQQQHQQIHQDALDSNPNKHTGSANIENPNNNYESIQLIEAIPDSEMVRVIAARGLDTSQNIKANADTPSMVSLAAVGDQLSNNLLEMRRKVREHMDAGPERDRVEAIMKDAATGTGTTSEVTNKTGELSHEQKHASGNGLVTHDKAGSHEYSNHKSDSAAETSEGHRNKTAAPSNESMRKGLPADSSTTEAKGFNIVPREVAETHRAFKQVIVGKGDTLWNIARKDLGENAGAENVRAYTDIIAHDNKLANPDRLEIGQKLILRGFQSNPLTEQSPQIEVFQDELKTIDAAPAPSDSIPAPAVNAVAERHHYQELEHMLDTQYPETGDGPVEFVTEQNHESIGKETNRAHLLEVAKNHNLDVSLTVDILEDRVARKQTTPEEVRKTYEQVERLLETESTAGIDKNQREILAQQILLHAAEPDKISQGMFNTCNVATVECRVFERTPSAAAKLITDLALDGKTTVHASDGISTTFERNPAPADSMYALDVPPMSGQRSYASELFQVCAVNIHYMRAGKGLVYEQLPVVFDATGQLANPEDNGERLWDDLKRPGSSPDLPDNSFIEIYNAITGKNDSNFMLANENVLYGPKDGVTLIDSQHELENQLQKIDKAHGFPVIIKVCTAYEPFWSNGNFGAAGGAGGADGGWHVVTIRGIEDVHPMRIRVDNQWTDEADHLGRINSLSSEQLFMSMRDCSDSLVDMGDKVRGGIRHGRRDLGEELDYQRLRLMNNQDLKDAAIDPSAVIPGLVPIGEIEKDVINILSTSFGKGNHLDEFEKKVGSDKVDQLLARFPLDSRIKIQQERDRLDLVPHELYLSQLQEFGVTSLDDIATAPDQVGVFRKLVSALNREEQAKIIRYVNSHTKRGI
ncbi:MAG: LysM domain-containing protein [Candidatus Melainabacteria bacterium]|nr:LysM domain-containing protein [Candidatus Melainabacteria bacterium]